MKDLCCTECDHLQDGHQLLTYEVREGGAMVCPQIDCICVGTWAPGWLNPDGSTHQEPVPPFEVVVALVTEHAKANEWSEDRLLHALAAYQRKISHEGGGE